MMSLALIFVAGLIVAHFVYPSATAWLQRLIDLLVTGWIVLWVVLNARRLRPPGGWSNT
jgi:uncharacterized membrane protein YGL010W